jgi:hypothetical protein
MFRTVVTTIAAHAKLGLTGKKQSIVKAWLKLECSSLLPICISQPHLSERTRRLTI